ncbi:MAG: leucine-rich repeat domain-containing protein [Ruminococcus sp.]|nr:leucine-rich repeat domain-containing protein [Ruminococcus sp.]
MQCENCHVNIPIGSTVCPECRTLQRYNVRDFDNTRAVQRMLKMAVKEQAEIIADTEQLIAVIYDYIPGYETEGKLLAKALRGGILELILTAQNKKYAFTDSRKYMIKDLGFTKKEAEFVLASLGYMLGFAYPSPLMVVIDQRKAPEPAKKAAASADGESGETAAAAPDAPLPPDLKVYKKLDAFIHRLSKTVTVKEGFTKLDGYCFDSFRMKSASLPGTLRVIGEYAFSDCKRLEELTVPANVRKIEKGAFNACVGLKKLKLPEGLLDIGDNTFLCCTSLKGLRVPNSVSSIGENAFSGCGELERLVIAQQVKFVDDNAFAYCPKLTIYCYENSYIHKYCMQNNIKFVTSPMGTVLPDGDEGKD